MGSLPEGETPELQVPAPATFVEPEVEPTNTEYEDSAALAYAAYVEEVGGVAFNGAPIPEWNAIKERQRNGWRAAVKAVKAKKNAA